MYRLWHGFPQRGADRPARTPGSFIAALKEPQELEQIVNVLPQRGIPITYMNFSDEGHSFVVRKIVSRPPQCCSHFSVVISAAMSGPMAQGARTGAFIVTILARNRAAP
jgi:hypothetical protein